MSIVIDADKLWKAITTNHVDYIELGKLGELIYDGEMEAPTAQKTGHWIRSAICQSISTGDGCGVGIGYEIFKCSCCGDERSNESNYCQNCGSLNRSEGEEDE